VNSNSSVRQSCGPQGYKQQLFDRACENNVDYVDSYIPKK